MTDDKKFITVKEVIEILKAYDPDLPVMTDGYEGGYESYFEVNTLDVYYSGPDSYMGDYSDAIGAHEGSEIIKVVAIGLTNS